MANPVIKTCGGKRQLLSQIMPHVPESFGTYHEPFVGGGALFFYLQAQGRITRAILSDANERLIRTYRAVRDDAETVLALFDKMPIDKESFLRIRGEAPDDGSDVEIAAWYLFINRAGFNGLYRVNKRGMCNVPYGTPKTPLLDSDALRAASAALQGVELLHEDFAGCERAEAGDFAYFDPPYVPLSPTSSFVTYTSDGFNEAAQRRLRDQIQRMKGRGVHVLASNSDTAKTREIYDGFDLRQVQARRQVNCQAWRRGKVDELLIS